MIEDLHHLLSGHHLLDVAVQVAQASLLLAVVGLAALSAVTDVEEHDHIAHRHHQGEPPVEDEEHGEGAHHLDEALDDHGEGVVEGVGDGVHVVGEVAHDVAMAAGVEEPEGQGLEVGEEIPADVEEDLLGSLDHGLGIAPGGEGTGQVDAGSEGHALEKGLHTAGGQVVDHRADHVGAQEVAEGADGDQHRHHQQQVFVPPHVGERGAQGVGQIFRLLGAELSGRHGPPLLSSGMCRSPGKWGRRPGAARGYRWRGSYRPPG